MLRWTPEVLFGCHKFSLVAYNTKLNFMWWTCLHKTLLFLSCWVANGWGKLESSRIGLTTRWYIPMRRKQCQSKQSHQVTSLNQNRRQSLKMQPRRPVTWAKEKNHPLRRQRHRHVNWVTQVYLLQLRKCPLKYVLRQRSLGIQTICWPLYALIVVFFTCMATLLLHSSWSLLHLWLALAKHLIHFNFIL